MIFYPTTIDQIKDKDEYQILVPYADEWSEIKMYSPNICRSKKEYTEYLINKQRLRVIKDG